MNYLLIGLLSIGVLGAICTILLSPCLRMAVTQAIEEENILLYNNYKALIKEKLNLELKVEEQRQELHELRQQNAQLKSELLEQVEQQNEER